MAGAALAGAESASLAASFFRFFFGEANGNVVIVVESRRIRPPPAPCHQRFSTPAPTPAWPPMNLDRRPSSFVGFLLFFFVFLSPTVHYLFFLLFRGVVPVVVVVVVVVDPIGKKKPKR